MKYLAEFLLFELEKVGNVDLDQTSVLLTQGSCNVPLKVGLTVRVSQGASWIHSFIQHLQRVLRD